jgi:hypothetical protein
LNGSGRDVGLPQPDIPTSREALQQSGASTLSYSLPDVELGSTCDDHDVVLACVEHHTRRVKENRGHQPAGA